MNNAPIREAAGDAWSTGWINWFAQVVLGLGGWRKTVTVTQSIDFPSIAAQSQAGVAIYVLGARQGDAVLVTPYADVPGVMFSGVCTSNDQVTVYGKNFTAGAINPANTSFHLVIFQN